jgi:hypothetical protein
LATSFISRLRQCFLPRGRRLSALFSNRRLGLSVPLVSLVGYGLCSRGSHLLTLFFRLQRASAAFLLMLQAGKSGLTLLSPRGLASEPGMEASTAKPQEDDLGCRHLLCLGSALATSRLLVEDVLATHSLLAFEGSLFVKKALSGVSSLLAGGLLAYVGSTLIKKALAGCHLEAVALVLPQFVDRLLPILVGAFRASASPKKNGPPRQFWRQQAGGLLVFVKCSLEPFLVVKGMTNIGRGIEFLKIVEHPVGGAWGRLRPLVLQPPGRIGEGGCGQMSRRWSTVPHLWRRMRGGVSAHLYQFQCTKVQRN